MIVSDARAFQSTLLKMQIFALPWVKYRGQDVRNIDDNNNNNNSNNNNNNDDDDDNDNNIRFIKR